MNVIFATEYFIAFQVRKQSYGILQYCLYHKVAAKDGSRIQGHILYPVNEQFSLQDSHQILETGSIFLNY